jgi:excisionase family DNA binding protein
MSDEATQFLTVKELCAKCRLSPASVYRLTRQRKIPFFQPAGKGGALRFPPDAIERATEATPQSNQPPDAHSNATKRHLSGRPPAWMQDANSQNAKMDNAT